MEPSIQRESFTTRLRNNFLTGLIICAPMAITIWLTWTFIHWADSWVKPYIPVRYNPESYLKFAIPGFGLLIAVVLITVVGLLGKNLIGRTVVEYGERLVHRMPLVSSIYRGVKQIFESVLKEQSTSFKKVGLIEYPSPGLWSLVFISGEPKGELAVRFNELGEEVVAVFLPPTPIPTAGFLIYVPKRKIVMLDMSPEDAAKVLLSAGLITPDYKPKLAKAAEEPAPAGSTGS
ncbi:DUF502 domain-containing protein [Gellertiella hungarica]|uniref:Putative membrane protein n=1 Tax=Gellertiella hungarica TaxID=1572859 RepID=A0A7W6J4S8_9HYPH|nr:DUF502 domain-containing protein [Gellertiella hungarica]MBB4064804.1 putative membrane protein [Gellertiella hungarica]